MEAPFFIALVLGFLCGSMPFSVWIGQVLLGEDVRRYGDGNPGATNVFRAGGWKAGMLALLFDFLKGAVPTGLAHWRWGLEGGALVLVAMAPILGHHFSPFLGFRGGKAVTTSFGVWSALTLWEGPLVLGSVLTLCYMVQTSDGWSVIIGTTSLLLYWVIRGADSTIIGLALANLLFLMWTHRHALGEPMRWRKH
jgi:glycerol-3-phosphate acyltransferase PlsY